MTFRKTITGRVDRVSADEIIGWIASHDRTGALESVFVETDQAERLEFKAIIYRLDVAEKLNRQEKFGFAIPLSALEFKKSLRVTDRYGDTIENGVVDLGRYKKPERPRREHCSVFLHIQKTAGTALSFALRKHMLLSDVCLFYPGIETALDWDALNALPAHQCKAFRLLIGHTSFGLDKFLRQPTKYYTFMREPLARIKSHYWHYRTNKIDALNIEGESRPRKFGQ